MVCHCEDSDRSVGRRGNLLLMMGLLHFVRNDVGTLYNTFTMKKNYTILAIDTSCDETSVAVTQDDRVISNSIFSQVIIHKKWGGVVPMLAKRAHEERIDMIIKKALQQAYTSINVIDAIAVTVGPGLAPALEVGVRKAKELAKEFHKPLIAVNHMEGHLLSSFAKNARGRIGKSTPDVRTPSFPLLGLLISGGHTELVLVKTMGEYEVIGETLDDAVGEAFDKVARLLDLGYPGGPIVERLAQEGDEFSFDLPVPMKGRKDLAFSYSGLKTAAKYLVGDIKRTKGMQLPRQTICDIAASFQRVATTSLIDRLERAISIYKPKGLLLGGGVISNLYVRHMIRRSMKPLDVSVYVPYSKKLYTDNAGMIGVTAFFKAKRGEFVTDIAAVDRQPNLSL